MNNDLLTMSAQSLNNIFTHFSNDTNSVFWIRTPDYQKQIYVSETYQDLWGRDKSQLYEYPTSWNDTLHGSETDDTVFKLINRTETDNTYVYQIHTPNNKITTIKDTVFLIQNPQGATIGVAGIAKPMNEQELEATLLEGSNSHQTDQPAIGNILSCLSEEFNITNKLQAPKKHFIIQHNQIEATLTRREAQCVYYLMQGYHNKMIAEKMFVSPRTVDTHIINIKYKLKCRSRLEIISQLANYRALELWSF